MQNYEAPETHPWKRPTEDQDFRESSDWDAQVADEVPDERHNITHWVQVSPRCPITAHGKYMGEAGKEDSKFECDHIFTEEELDLKTLLRLEVVLTPHELAAGIADSDSAAVFGYHDEDILLSSANAFPVFLQVYDILHMLKRSKIPVFHVGVEVHGREISFGSRGIKTSLPGANKLYMHRERVCIGSTLLTAEEVDELRKRLKPQWPKERYNPLWRNCQVFAATFCEYLGMRKGCIPLQYCALSQPDRVLEWATSDWLCCSKGHLAHQSSVEEYK